jgi:hypothetical protein
MTPPRLREAAFDDYAQIAKLEARYGLETAAFDEWRHYWSDNPAYKFLSRSWPIGWVLEDADQQIVGSIGNIPLLYEMDGKQYLAATGRSWVSDPVYRGYAMLLLDRLFGQDAVDLVVNTTLNATAAPAFAIFGAARVPVGQWDASAFWVTCYRSLSEVLLTRKGLSVVAKPLSYPVSLGLLCAGKLRGRALRRQEGRYTIAFERTFGPQFDEFWMELKRLNPDRFLACRSRETLEWHFRSALANDKAWILTLTQGARLTAYAIFCRRDGESAGLRRMQLADLQSLELKDDLLETVLSEAVDRCRRDNIHMLENIGCFFGARRIPEDFAPFRRKLPSWTYFYKAKATSLAAKLESPEVWAPSSFDGDATL